MIILVDFDGTLAEHNFPFIGKEVPHAFSYLKKFVEAGAKLILYTMRSDNQVDYGDILQEAVDWCQERGIEFWAINENPDQWKWTDSPKLDGNIVVDDRTLFTPLIYPTDGSRPYVNWKKVGPKIMEKLNAK